MTSPFLRCIQLTLTIAVAVSGFQASSPTSLRLHRFSMHLRMSPSAQQHDTTVKGDKNALNIPSSHTHNKYIRPIILSTAAAASIFASTPLTAHADTITADSNQAANDNIIMHTTSYSTAIQHPMATVSSSLQLSSSTLANPIGEVQDGSDTGGVGSSFGQWFFLLYVVVSLLAGGKEMLGRLQKQMDKES